MILAYNEGCLIFTAVKSTEEIKGVLAEVGVFKGGSAKIICEAKGRRALHLFDTFEGMPEVSGYDASYRKGQFKATLGSVKDFLKGYPNVHFHKGVFPENTKLLRNKKFAFVNLDVDIYESTLNCIKFFYPRMSKGGIIISHDYNYPEAPGVKKAFGEFFKGKPEPIIELTGSQCMVMKL